MITPDPFHAGLGKQSTQTQTFRRERKNKPLKLFLQCPLKCKLLSLMGSPLYSRHSSEYLWACSPGKHPFVYGSKGVLINYYKLPLQETDGAVVTQVFFMPHYCSVTARFFAWSGSDSCAHLVPECWHLSSPLSSHQPGLCAQVSVYSRAHQRKNR